jgi:hypothetical protein
MTKTILGAIVTAGCCDCEETWSGDNARDQARNHGLHNQHFTWIECAPSAPPPPADID